MREIDRMLARVPFAPVVAAMFAIVAIVLIGATPQWLFERWVVSSEVASIIPAATPPLGETARILAAIAAGVVTAALIWLGLTLAGRLNADPDPADVNVPAPRERSVRRPLSAGHELGAPLMSDEAMAQAREELILDAPIEEAALDASAVPIFDADEAVAKLNVESPDAAFDSVPAPLPVRARSVAGQSIPTLLDRLETAIAKKPRGYRPDRDDVARLRSALGR